MEGLRAVIAGSAVEGNSRSVNDANGAFGEPSDIGEVIGVP